MSANTVDNGLGDLQPASFRGVPFGVMKDEGRFGRSIALHEYPFKDKQWPEDIGRATRKFTIQGFLITDSLVYGGGDVNDQRMAMIGAVETLGPGTLIHPTLGRLQVSIPEDGLILSGELNAGTYAEFTLFCFEAGERTFPTASASQSDDAGSAADNIDSATSSDFMADVTGALQYGAFVVSIATQTARAWVGTLEMVAYDVTGIFNMAAQLPGQFGRFFNGALAGYAAPLPPQNAILTLEGLVTSGAQTRAQLVDAGAALVQAAAALEPSGPTPAAQAAISLLVAAATNPADGVRLLAQLAGFFPNLPNGPSVIGQASAEMQTAFATMLRRTTLAGLVRVAATYQPQSEADASNVRLTICGLLDAEALLAGDAGDDLSYMALTEAMGTVAAILDAAGAQLPPMQQFTFQRSQPSLVLAQRIYQDSTRADELVAEAAPPHPLFMPLSFMALSS